jgi:hypothetical protein
MNCGSSIDQLGPTFYIERASSDRNKDVVLGCSTIRGVGTTGQNCCVAYVLVAEQVSWNMAGSGFCRVIRSISVLGGLIWTMMRCLGWGKVKQKPEPGAWNHAVSANCDTIKCLHI